MNGQKAVDPLDLIGDTPISRYQWLIFGLCGALMMLEGFDVQAIAFAAPEIGREWHLASAAFGPVFSAGLLGGIVGGAVIAPMGDRFGPRRILAICAAVFGLFTLLTVFADTLMHLIVLRMIAGAGITASVPCIVTLLAAYSPRRFQSLLVVGALCFQLLGAVVGGAVSAQMMPAFGWQSIFILGGLTPLILAPIAAILLPEPMTYLLAHGHENRAAHTLVRMGKLKVVTPTPMFRIRVVPERRVRMVALLRDGRTQATIFLWLANVTGVMYFYFLANWIPTILRESGASLKIAVFGGVALNCGGMIGALIFSRLIDRLGMRATIASGYIAGGIVIWVVGLPGINLMAMLPLVFLCGLLGLGVQCCLTALVVRLYPSDLHTTAVGSTFAFGRLGAMIGPLVGSWLLLSGALPRELFYFAAAAAVTAGIFVSGIRVREEKSREVFTV